MFCYSFYPLIGASLSEPHIDHLPRVCRVDGKALRTRTVDADADADSGHGQKQACIATNITMIWDESYSELYNYKSYTNQIT